MDKLIIEVRINEYASRKHNPHVPFSPNEICDDALRCRNAGASIIHYHARDPVTITMLHDIAAGNPGPSDPVELGFLVTQVTE